MSAITTYLANQPQPNGGELYINLIRLSQPRSRLASTSIYRHSLWPSTCKTEIINLTSILTLGHNILPVWDSNPSSPSLHSTKTQSPAHPAQRLLSSLTGNTPSPTGLAPTPVKF